MWNEAIWSQHPWTWPQHPAFTGGMPVSGESVYTGV